MARRLPFSGGAMARADALAGGAGPRGRRASPDGCHKRV